VSNNPSFHDVSVYIETDGANKLKIQSDQLEKIGAQLRGRKEFSIFNSIILPLIVSVVTVLISSGLQFVSWFNDVGVKEATDVADKAVRSYEHAAAAIGTRHYAMLVFLPSLRDLVHAKANANAVLAQSRELRDQQDSDAEGSLLAQIKEIKNKEFVYPQPNARKQGPDAKRPLLPQITKIKTKDDPVQPQSSTKKRAMDAERSPLKAMAQSTDATKDQEISLHKYDLEIKQKRFASYYEQLKSWNENYDRLLSDIEYALDRPVFAQADQANQDFRVSRTTFGQINCLNVSIAEELQKLNLNPHSLKFRFAGLNNCFVKAHKELDKRLTLAISEFKPTLSGETESEIYKKFEALLMMGNEFRCYAHQRMDYYDSQRQLAIVSPSFVVRRLTDATKAGALKHFEDASNRCDAQKTSVSNERSKPQV
jgi:hypothetical protein